MGRSGLTVLLAMLSAGTAPQAARAQDAGSNRPIIIVGQRPLSGVPPERLLGEEEIESYGIGTVGELLDEVAAENGEGADEPVILVNGEPVASIADIEDYPAEAVSQLEILPRGSATRVGASANRRVYNVLLKRQASILVGRTSVRAAIEGGWSGGRGDLNYSHIRGSRRLNTTARLRREGALLESERDIVQPLGSPDDLSRFRTLHPSLRDYQLGLSVADRPARWLTAGLTGKLVSGRGRSLLGIGADGSPLRRRSRALTGNADVTLNATAGSWLVSFLGTYLYDRRRTLTDDLAGTSRINARATSLNGDLTGTGPLFTLPAGPARLTLGAVLGRDSISGEGDGFRQWSKSVKGGLEVPIASASNGFVPALGELSASAQLTRTHVSHFGWFDNQTYALSWQPAEWLRLFGSVTTNRIPPAVRFLADPLLETPGVRYFDPQRDETVDVMEISGGNPNLTDQSAANRRLSANLKPFKSLPLQLTTEYSEVRNRDIVTALPPASDLIFLAFPERFVRDPGGTLTVVDVRPVQFARERQKQLRTGVNLSLLLGGGAAGVAAVAPATDQNSDEGAQPAPRRAARPTRPRVTFNLSHIWMLESELLIREGIDAIDLLSRNAIGLGGATRPRHQLDFTLGYSERGLGLRLASRHRGRSFLRLVSNGDTEVLRFSPLTTFRLRAWAEPSRFAPNADWLKGSRLSLSVLNITNKRQRVTDSAGLTPLAYQKGYRDPRGRIVEVEFRKTF